MKSIPLVDLRAQYLPLKDEIIVGIEQVLGGMHLFLGENVRKLEEEFSEYCGAQFGIGVSDGTTALHVILRAMGIGSGDEVITVSHTFIATVEAVLLAGAKPVFVDINPDTYLMDVSQVEEKITSRTKAILPVHLYGQTVDFGPLREIASRHGLKLVEDSCQAHGAANHGQRAGGLGDAAAFSFYYSKNLGAYGEGGFVTTDDFELASQIRKIRDHGSGEKYHHDVMGFNGRLDELQAVVLRAKLPHLNDWNDRRRERAALYDRLLKGMPVKIPAVTPGNTPVYHLYVISTSQRDELQSYLMDKGIATGIHYPIPVHLQNSMRNLGYEVGSLPVTEKAVSEILSLPIYPEITEEEIECIASAIGEFFD